MGASDGLFLPGLMSLLGHRTLKADARDTLVGYGEAIVGALDYALRDGFLRYKSIAAVERLVRDHPELSFPRPVVEKLL